MRRSYTFIFLLTSLLGFTCRSQPETKAHPGLPEKVVQLIENRIEEELTPSVALALIDSTGVTYFNFGKTKAEGTEVNAHTIYEIGSITKVFTGILLAHQILNGDLKADTPINQLLPDSIQVPYMGEEEITLGHLTDHTSGFPRMPSNFKPANFHNPFADYTVEQLYDYIATYEPTRKVGAEYEYSNLAQGLLGHILALQKNTTYEALVKAVISDPLQMDETGITLTGSMQENLAVGHRGPYIVENWDIPTLAGAGALRSSTADMAQFIAANLGFRETNLLPALELSHQIRHNKADGMSVGMGWHVQHGAEGDVIWHNGGTGGYRTFAGFCKDTGKGVVLLTNSTAGSDDIGFYLLDSSSELKE